MNTTNTTTAAMMLPRTGQLVGDLAGVAASGAAGGAGDSEGDACSASLTVNDPVRPLTSAE